MEQKTRIMLSCFVTAAALFFLSGSPAGAWGGPTSFGSNCSGISIKTASNGQAAAHTLDINNAGLALRVAFRGGGHLDIAPQTGTNVVRSYISQSVVNSYDVTGGFHRCAAATHIS